MLFTSKDFIFIFVPLLILLIFCVVKFSKSHTLYKFSLIFFSLIFYGAWNLKFLIFFLTLVFLNFLIINFLIKFKIQNRSLPSFLLILFNLSILIYYKYFNFFLINLNSIFNIDYAFKNIILPLGISFIILQQISFIWTATDYKKKINLTDFLFFSFFFPQIIAGPILIYDDLKNQLSKKFFNISSAKIWQGIQIFFIGFFKKVFIADKLAIWVTAFNDSNSTSIDYFISVVAYGFQIYFDFSAYSDMAVGLALIFGLSIPVNFFSPLKSKSISEFWQRWHITLTRFLENIVYFPLILSLGRIFKINSPIKGIVIISLTTIITFFASGFWHGAGWNYVAFGLYHGFFVILHRMYLFTVVQNKQNTIINIILPNYLKILITNIVVLLSWVLFGSADLTSAINYYQSLFNIFDGSWKLIFSMDYAFRLLTLTFLFIVCTFLPNSYQLINYRFKQKKYTCSKKISNLIFELRKKYVDLFIIVIVLVYWTRISFENKAFIYYQF